MHVVTVWNLKGGVGKTTISFNVATILARRGHKVLCLDFDSQANLTSFFEKDLTKRFSKRDVGKLATMKFQDMGKSAYKSRFKELDYIRGCNSEMIIEDIESLQRELQKMSAAYDYCIIDCHPDFSRASQSALYASDLVLVPIALDSFSRDNLNLVSSHIDRIESVRNGKDLDYWIFGNRVAYRKSQVEVYKDLVSKHDYPMLDLCISESAAVSSANVVHKPIYAHRKKTACAHDLEELADVIEVGVN